MTCWAQPLLPERGFESWIMRVKQIEPAKEAKGKKHSECATLMVDRSTKSKQVDKTGVNNLSRKAKESKNQVMANIDVKKPKYEQDFVSCHELSF